MKKIALKTERKDSVKLSGGGPETFPLAPQRQEKVTLSRDHAHLWTPT